MPATCIQVAGFLLSELGFIGWVGLIGSGRVGRWVLGWSNVGDCGNWAGLVGVWRGSGCRSGGNQGVICTGGRRRWGGGGPLPSPPRRGRATVSFRDLDGWGINGDAASGSRAVDGEWMGFRGS